MSYSAMKQGCKMSDKGVIRDFLVVQGLRLGIFTDLALSKNNGFFFLAVLGFHCSTGSLVALWHVGS